MIQGYRLGKNRPFRDTDWAFRDTDWAKIEFGCSPCSGIQIRRRHGHFRDTLLREIPFLLYPLNAALD